MTTAGAKLALVVLAVVTLGIVTPAFARSRQPVWSKPAIVAGLRDWTQVAVTSDGRQAFVAWVAAPRGSPGGRIHFRSLGDGNTPGPLRRIDTTATTSQEPSIAATGRHVCVTWIENYGIADGAPHTEARVRCSHDSGATWDGVYGLDSDQGEVIAAGPGFVFLDIARGHYRARTSRDGGRSWSAPTVVTTEPRDVGWSDAWYERGALLFAYERIGGQTRSMVLRRSSDAGRSWSPPRVVTDGAEVRFPEVAANSDGTILMAWWDGDRNAIMSAASRNLGREWSEPTAINSDVGVTQIPFALTFADDAFIAVWGRRQARVHGDLWSTSSADGHTWSDPETMAPASERAYSITLTALGDPAILAYASSERRAVLIRISESG